MSPGLDSDLLQRVTPDSPRLLNGKDPGAGIPERGDILGCQTRRKLNKQARARQSGFQQIAGPVHRARGVELGKIRPERKVPLREILSQHPRVTARKVSVGSTPDKEGNAWGRGAKFAQSGVKVRERRRRFGAAEAITLSGFIEDPRQRLKHRAGRFGRPPKLNLQTAPSKLRKAETGGTAALGELPPKEIEPGIRIPHRGVSLTNSASRRAIPSASSSYFS
ncbi:MAG: hypothetical protein GHCLOJNM_00714 [bacterium]|nr:hypothetical protein [bacterium]